MISITPIYAAICALIYVYLSFRVIGGRRSTSTSLGDGGDDALQRSIRVHGNFAEYVPMMLILMALAELQSVPAVTLHALGILMLAGRLSHAYGLPGGRARSNFRVAGMIMTFIALISGATLNLGWSALFGALPGAGGG